MGGSPTISGGMTQSEYSAMLDRQNAEAEAREVKMREFYEEQFKKQEETARKLAEEMQLKEKAAIQEARQAEQGLLAESTAQQQQQEGTGGGGDEDEERGTTDFYSSLYQGTEQRPE